MAINTIIESIVCELQSNITDLHIEQYPDNPTEYKLIHPKGAILVAFNGANYEQAQTLDYIQQTGIIEIGINLIIKGLRDKNGAYTYIDNIISVLTGFTPTDCLKMYPNNVTFLNETNGIWEYGLSFNVPIENYNYN